MKRLFAAFCAFVMVLSVVNPAVFAAEATGAATNGAETFGSLQAAVDGYTGGVIVLNEDAENLVVTKDVYVDLNGHDIAGVTVEAGTLYCMDSETNDYTVKDGVYGKLTGVSGNVAAVPEEAACAEHGYLKVAEEDGISFHCVNLKISAMTLRASEVGVYYKSHFAGDELVAAQVESFGVALSVITAPEASNLETYCAYSVFKNFRAGEGSNSGNSTGTLLRDIMKAANTDKINSRNANMPIYGRAYIKTADGYLFGATAKRSLKEQVEAIDTKWIELVDTKRAPISAMYEQFASVMNAWNIPNIKGADAPSADGVITVPVYVPAKNGVVTETTVVNAKGVSITVPAGTKLAEGATKLTLTVTPKETTDVEITLEDAQVMIPVDVHVDGIAADNTAPLTIYLGKVMAENLNMGNYTVYHVENGKANEMQLIAADEEFTAHNQYKYTLDGEVYLYMASFSDVLLVADQKNAWNGKRDYTWYNTTDKILYIRNADQLAGFGAIVGGMDGQKQDSFKNKTVILLADISIGDLDSENGIVFYPIGYWNSELNYKKGESGEGVESGFYSFEGIFDGNGNAISNFYQNTWEMKGDHNWYAPEDQHYRDGMGLFGYVKGGTIKNLTVDKFSSDGEITTTGVIAAYADSTSEKSVTFENIVVTNSNPRVYNIGNGGIVGSAGWYSRNDKDVQPIILKNITVDDTNTVSALWGSWDVGCGGLVGRYYPDAYQNLAADEYGILFENCYVAATIDVYNDVCGNYQYYWYRYCGMIIGTVEKSTADGGADLTGIKAVNCIADFGNRHEYYYCEFVKNSIASYTHDHQFSRISHSDLIYTDTNGNGELDAEEATTVQGCINHNHEAAGKETINGVEVLKEDNQAIYLPFRQLFGGNGWGIKGVSAYPNIQITTLNASTAKFDKAANAKTEIASGATITIGELFAAKKDAGISGKNVQVFVSPADPMDLTNTAAGTYVANTSDWTKGTLTFSGMGAAKVTISDYNNCVPTTLEIEVKPVAELNGVQYASAQDALDAAKDGDTVILLENVETAKYLDIKMPEQADRHITLDLAGHTITPAANYKYEYYPLVFVGVNQDVTIKNGAVIADEHVAVGVYGTLTLENVNIDSKQLDKDEAALCVWDWIEGDVSNWMDYADNVIGVAYIKSGEISSMLIEGVAKISGGTFGTEVLPEYCATGYAPVKIDENTWTVEPVAVEKPEVVLNDGKYVIVAEYNGVSYALPVPTNDAAETQKAQAVTIVNGEVQSAEGLVWEVVNTDKGIVLKAGDKYLAIPNAKDAGVKLAGAYDWSVVAVEGAYEITSYEADNRALYFRGGKYMTFGAYSINNKIAKDYVATLKIYPVVEEDKPEETTATITFDSTAKRTEFTTEKQVWEENGITVTNNKDKSTSDVGDYAAPARFYKNSELVIAFAEPVTKIEFNCNTAAYATDLAASIEDETTVNGKVVTVVFAEAVETYTINLTSAQVRMDSITVTVGGGAEPEQPEQPEQPDVPAVCEHTNTTLTDVVAATCGKAGYTGDTVCDDCGETIATGKETAALEHNYVDGKCEHCGATQPGTPVEPSYSWVKADLADIDADDVVVITMTKGGTTWALTSVNGSSSAPTAVVVTVDGDKITSEVADALKWNISNSSDKLTITVNGNANKWLYCTNDNNGVRVGTNANKIFTIDATSGYLKNTATSRYVGVYTSNPDWRCYTNTTGNTAGQTLAFYVLTINCAHTNTEAVAAKDATCTEAGMTAGVKCVDCQTIISGCEVVTALGHEYEEEVTTEATCEAEGEMTFTCANCGDSYTGTIDATGHNYGTDKVVIDATCTTDGSETGTCENCGKEDVTVIPATGHSYDTGKVTTAATCVNTGVKTYTCSACGDTKTETIPATGEHTYVNNTCTGCGEKENVSIGTQLIDRIANLTAGTYKMAGFKNNEYYLSTGSVSSGDLVTSVYTFANNQLTAKSTDNAVDVELVAVEGKANTYYIKINNKYLYSTAANNRKLALGTTPTEWVAKNNSKGGITLTSNSVNLGTNNTASSNLIRSYKNESTLTYGVVFFKEG